MNFHKDLKMKMESNFRKYTQIIERFGLPPITNSDELPPAQLQRHGTNPLATAANTFNAINIHVPYKYQALYRALILDLAADKMEWKYVDISMLRIFTHKEATRDQMS